MPYSTVKYTLHTRKSDPLYTKLKQVCTKDCTKYTQAYTINLQCSHENGKDRNEAILVLKKVVIYNSATESFLSAEIVI